MKKNHVIYWASTGLLSFMMLFSAWNYFTNPQMSAAFKHLGFSDYFRYELAIAKIAGALVLLVPQIPVRLKEWAYAGFAITFISASIAHYSSGDPVAAVITPLVFLAVLAVSYVFLFKKNRKSTTLIKTSFA
ncbi:MAG: DoxX family protein [Ferruginibacter sp.]